MNFYNIEFKPSEEKNINKLPKKVVLQAFEAIKK